MSDQIHIGIAEDHDLVRQGLVNLLRIHKRINVLFDVPNGKELLEKLKAERPHVLLLDMEMPVMKGQEVLERISVKYPKVKVIVVSAFFQRDYIVESFRLGTKAFLSKNEKIERIIEAIYSVHEKGIFSDDEVTKILASEIQNSNVKRAKKSVLSTTELEVLRLICKGTTRQKAADLLGVKLETINFHMSNMKRKTGVENTFALVNYAIQNKLVVNK